MSDTANPAPPRGPSVCCPPCPSEHCHPPQCLTLVDMGAGRGSEAMRGQTGSTAVLTPYSPCSLLCPRSTMATYSATCTTDSPAQGVSMANSIASLRLKAKEYSLQRGQVPTVN